MSDEMIVLAAAAALAAIVALRWPMAAVCGFVGLVLSNTPGVLVNVHELPSIGTVLVPALVVLLAIRSISGREQPEPATSLLLPTLIYFVVTSWRTPWAGDRGDALEEVNELARNLVIFLVLVGFLTTPKRLEMAARTGALTLGALGLVSTIQYATGRFDTNFLGYAQASLQQISEEIHGWRVSGPLPDPNFFAQLLVCGLPIALAMAAGGGWLYRTLGAVSAAAMLSGILLTYSRGALVALLAVGIAYMIMSRRRSILATGILLALATTVTSAVVAPAGLGERFGSAVETVQAVLGNDEITGDTAVIQRVSVMRAAIRMFLDHPLLGMGPAQFRSNYESYAIDYDLDLQAPPAAHSLYLEIAAEQGVVGLALFGGLIVASLSLARTATSRLVADGNPEVALTVQGLMLGLVGYLLTAVFLHDAYPRPFWVLLALVVASRSASRRLTLQNPLRTEEPAVAS